MAPIPQIPLEDAKNISLDISGVAGFFGGDVAVKAMSTVHVYAGRRWLGWYNTPGSYEIAKRYGQVARSRFWDGLYPGPNHDPAELFEFDGKKGPSYNDILSGTTMRKTGHLADLFTQACKHEPVDPVFATSQKRYRKTRPVDVTIARLHHEPDKEMHPGMVKGVERAKSSLFAHIPILISLAACILCGLYEDWISFSMILVGMLSNGISCWWIGSGRLTFSHPTPAKGSPSACGILNADGDHIVILKGPEGAVNCVTRGKFSLKYQCSDNFQRIGLCSLLLTVQFLAQLLLLPQGKKFGQIMFLVTLAVSWMYNSYLASIDCEGIQRHILIKDVLQDPIIKRYTLGTRTAMAVFVLLVLSNPQPSTPSPTEGSGPDDHALRRVLDDLLPNDTPVWRDWKGGILDKIRRYNRGEEVFASENSSRKSSMNSSRSSTLDSARSLSPEESSPLKETLEQDAVAAARAYEYYLTCPTAGHVDSDG